MVCSSVYIILCISPLPLLEFMSVQCFCCFLIFACFCTQLRFCPLFQFFVQPSLFVSLSVYAACKMCNNASLDVCVNVFVYMHFLMWALAFHFPDFPAVAIVTSCQCLGTEVNNGHQEVKGNCPWEGRH